MGEQEDVATTLSELERKLEDLETELHGAGRAAPVRAEDTVGDAETTTEAASASEAAAPPPPADASDAPPGVSPFAAALASSPGPFASPASLPVAREPVPPATTPVPPEPGASASVWTEPRALHDQLDDLERLREHLERSARAVMAEFDSMLKGLRAILGETSAPAPPGAAAGDAELDAIVLDGAVTVDAGPFADIATLSRFEQALRDVPGARDLHVRAFEGSRARIDVRLAGPVALGAELRRASEVAFTTTQAGDGRLAVTIDAGS